ncbi:hypothetical protein QYF36_006731 [Acer negundo]|nr:hypothetical protein QYF36_006731 [Acer negundo]
MEEVGKGSGGREGELIGGYVEGRKRNIGLELETGTDNGKKHRSTIAFDQESIAISQWNWDNKKVLQPDVRRKKTELALVYGAGEKVDWKRYGEIENELDKMFKAVAWVNNCGVGDWNYLQQILEIRSLLGKWGQISVEFSSRDSNVFADSLARNGAEVSGDLLDWRFS